MIPWEKLNLGLKKPNLAKKSLHYYVHHALAQPYFVNAGEWMLYNMMEDEVIERTEGENFRLCRITEARRMQMKMIPRALRAMYALSANEGEILFTHTNKVVDPEVIVSVVVALDRVEGCGWQEQTV